MILHAMYYTPSQAKFVCSSRNYNSCLFPKSQWTLSLPLLQNRQKKQLLLPRPLEGIGWDVEEQLYVPSVMSNTALLWLGPEREHSSLQPWPHQLHSTTFPWSWCSAFSQVLSNSLPSLKDFSLIPSFNQNQIAFLRLKRGKIDSSFPTDWK